MTLEATVVSQLTIAKNHLQIKSFPASFRATVDGNKGPSPGAITATTDGTLVDLSQLTTPGLYVIHNRDTVNYVEIGIWDGIDFFPMDEVQAGEHYVKRFSRNLSEAYSGTSPGTDPAGTTRVMIKANTADCEVSLEAYEA